MLVDHDIKERSRSIDGVGIWMEYSDSEDVASDFHSAKYVREKYIYIYN